MVDRTGISRDNYKEQEVMGSHESQRPEWTLHIEEENKTLLYIKIYSF